MWFRSEDLSKWALKVMLETTPMRAQDDLFRVSFGGTLASVAFRTHEQGFMARAGCCTPRIVPRRSFCLPLRRRSWWCR